jgi:hypothetical protein
MVWWLITLMHREDTCRVNRYKTQVFAGFMKAGAHRPAFLLLFILPAMLNYTYFLPYLTDR